MAQLRLVVLVNSAQWQVLRFSGSRCCELREFSTDADNQSELLNWLKQFPKAVICFLTDLADEHYHVEVLPHVSGTAEKQLLGRRLAAWPFAQELHAVHRLNSLQKSRRENRYLFSAIHYPPLVSWLQSLQHQGMRVQGVYTQALCLPCWISSLQPNSAHCLCVDFDRQQLRIRYLYQSRLLFSRVFTLPENETTSLRVASEIAQTRVYLINQRWLLENDTLHLFWVGESVKTSQLSSEQLPVSIKQTYVSNSELMQQLKLDPPPNGLSAINWAAAQVIIHTLQLPNLATVASLSCDRIARAKRTLQLVSAAMACLFAVACWSSQEDERHSQLRIQEATANLHLWQNALPSSEFAEADLPRLQTLVMAVQGIGVSARLPDHAFSIIQNMLTEFSLWQLQKIEWHDGYACSKTMHVDTGGAETMTVSFSRTKAVSELAANQEWRVLQEKLQTHSDIDSVVEINSSRSPESGLQHGDTRQAVQLGGQQILKICLRQKAIL